MRRSTDRTSQSGRGREGTRIRVVVADDHPIVREGIRMTLEGVPDIEIVGEVESGAEVEELCDRLRPDVLLLDASMPGPGVFDLLRLFQGKSSAPAVLVFSMHAELYARRAIDAGAAGFLGKVSAAALLPEAIRAIARGEAFCSELGLEALARGKVSPHCRLSPREFEVFLMLGRGMRVVEIARDLGLSPKTVSTHRRRILEKTGLETNAAIIRYVAFSGIRDRA